MKIVFLYAIAAGVIAIVTGPIPGTSVLLVFLELAMLIHLAKYYDYALRFGILTAAGGFIWGASTALKSLVLELFLFIWWLEFGLAQAFVAATFVLLFGTLASMFFSAGFGGKRLT